MAKVSDLIASLQAVLEKEGDLPLVYSSDDEGNAYHGVYGFSGVMAFESTCGNYLERVYDDECEEECGSEDFELAYCVN